MTTGTRTLVVYLSEKQTFADQNEATYLIARHSMKETLQFATLFSDLRSVTIKQAASNHYLDMLATSMTIITTKLKCKTEKSFTRALGRLWDDAHRGLLYLIYKHSTTQCHAIKWRNKNVFTCDVTSHLPLPQRNCRNVAIDHIRLNLLITRSRSRAFYLH